MAGLTATPTAAAAVRLVRRLGSMEQACTDRLGRGPIPPLMAQIGDVVLAPSGFPVCSEAEAGQGGDQVPDTGTGTGAIIGICNGALFTVRDVDGQITMLPMHLATAAWRINPIDLGASTTMEDSQ